MTIPQIKQSQVDTLVEMSQGLGAMSLPVADTKKDSHEKYNALTEELCDMNQLVILGLLKDITDDCGDKLAMMYAMSNRLFRVFEITDIGRAMFDSVERKVQ